jgi:hypothetical protein
MVVDAQDADRCSLLQAWSGARAEQKLADLRGSRSRWTKGLVGDVGLEAGARVVFLSVRLLCLCPCVAFAHDCYLRNGLGEFPQLFGRELEVSRPEVLLQVGELGRAGDGNDPGLLGEQPCQRYLRGGQAPWVAELGQRLADEHDLDLAAPHGETAKQVDPVNFERRDEPWRRRVFECVCRLVKLRTRSPALAFNETEFFHVDMSEGKRVLAWLRGRRGDQGMVVVVANFSDWGTPDPDDASSEYVVHHWPEAPGRRWREVTTDREAGPQRVGREPLRPWDAKVYELV